MKIPTRQQAEKYLTEAGILNPGPWVEHSRHTAEAARRIAAHHPAIDPEAAYILGLLHDIGRRDGIHGMRHVVDGYNFLQAEGYPYAARICLTHSYPIPDVNAGSNNWDGTPTERQFVADFLAQVEYTPYDRLIQICDALALPSGPVLMEKRLVDVVLRYGFNQYTLEKWRVFFTIQREFNEAIGQSIYSVLPGIVKTTFGLTISAS